MNMLLPAHSEVLRSVTVSYVDAQARTRAASARFHQWSIRCECRYDAGAPDGPAGGFAGGV